MHGGTTYNGGNLTVKKHKLYSKSDAWKNYTLIWKSYVEETQTDAFRKHTLWKKSYVEET